MRKILIMIILLGLVSVALAVDTPPILNNFEQFYGSVAGVSSTGFKVRAQISAGTPFETPIAANGQYGYSLTFKVSGQNGQTINFFIINSQGAATAVGTATAYNNMATTLLDFTYTAPLPPPSPSPPPTICGNNIREATESCDGTDLASQTCPLQVGVGSTGTLNCTTTCTFNITLCTASTRTCWECNDWGVCRNNSRTRTCGIVDCTMPNALRVEPSDEQFCPSTNQSSSSGPSVCTMSWECGAWSLCRNAQQTRICFRADNCDTLLAQGQITSVISALKPREEQTCQEGTPVTPAQICSSGMKRCLGPQLQLCSTGGLQWATLQTCPSSCDPISLTCRAEQAVVPPSTQKPSSSLWVYLLAGSVVLVLVIVSISITLLNKKKYAPAKEYIQENRARGIDDEQSREKLVEEGWDEKGVGRLFK